MEHIIKDIVSTHEDPNCGHVKVIVFSNDEFNFEEIFHISEFTIESPSYYSPLYSAMFNAFKNLNLSTKEELMQNLINLKYYA